MKSIIYILLVVFIGSIVVAAFPRIHSKPHYLLKIQTIEKNPPINLLSESCSIIKNRLKDNGLKNIELSLSPIPNTLEIVFSDSIELKEILPLFISKGKFEICETYASPAAMKLLQKDEKLEVLLNIPSGSDEMDNSSAIVASCKSKDKPDVEALLNKLNLADTKAEIKYLVSVNANDNGDYAIYAVKSPAAMQKSQIGESAVEKVPNEPDRYALLIKFSQSAISEWATLTKNNIGKSLAMVIDNRVYSAPRVMAEIKGGYCQITGNYSLNEIIVLKSLINCAELPLEFTFVK